MIEHLPFLFTGLLLGIGGSLHCVGMCGPLVIAMAKLSPTSGTVAATWQRSAGRLTTYASLGLAAGAVGHNLDLLGWQERFSLGMGILLLIGLCTIRPFSQRLGIPALVARLSRAWQSQFRLATPSGQFTLGLIHGLLPCGLVYVALAGAAATAHPVLGALFMMAFGLGTLPLLWGCARIATRFQNFSRTWQPRIVPLLVGLTGVLLVLRGLALDIPYLSPKSTATKPAACCQAALPTSLAPEMGDFGSKTQENLPRNADRATDADASF